jgi:two-component system, cell cycle sensor histidine kinase and response regulator CckA
MQSHRTNPPTHTTTPKSILDPSIIEEVEQIGAYLETISTHFDQASELAELGVFSSMFAHEVNNLMTQVGGRAQLALMHMDQPELTLRALEIACHASTQIAQLSEVFLESSRTDTRYSAQYKVGEIHEQALDFVCQEDINAYGFHLQGDGRTAHVAIVPVLLKQVLLNLYLNAIRAIEHGAPLNAHIPASGQISILAERIETRAGCSPWNIPRIRITVEDTGTGMEPEEIARIFEHKEPFKQSNPPKQSKIQQLRRACDQGRGHGLGLAICQKMIVEAGGTIHAESKPGVGTKMVINLPESTENASPPICGS